MAIRFDRLKEVVNVVKKVPPKLFRMNFWLDMDYNCQTAGCAVGHYCASHPYCQLRYDKTINNIINRSTGKIGYEGTAEYFGITEDECFTLFSGSMYSSLCAYVPKQHVIRRIKRFINMAQNAKAFDE
jgi:hypothetical protein